MVVSKVKSRGSLGSQYRGDSVAMGYNELAWSLVCAGKLAETTDMKSAARPTEYGVRFLHLRFFLLYRVKLPMNLRSVLWPASSRIAGEKVGRSRRKGKALREKEAP
jgi:hypothetical protein